MELQTAQESIDKQRSKFRLILAANKHAVNKLRELGIEEPLYNMGGDLSEQLKKLDIYRNLFSLHYIDYLNARSAEDEKGRCGARESFNDDGQASTQTINKSKVPFK